MLTDLWRADCKVSSGERNGHDISGIGEIAIDEQKGGPIGGIDAKVITIHVFTRLAVVFDLHDEGNAVVFDLVVQGAGQGTGAGKFDQVNR